MLKLQRITTADTALYQFMENLMKQAFPTAEYRDLDELRLYTDSKPHFYNNIIMEENHPIGFFTYWDFDTFYYAEHFAIDPALRNGGYGKQVLDLLCNSLPRPIVLEVEIPVDEMACRRIGFYERNGFTLWPNDYRQPPYRPGDGFLPMRLMVHGTLDNSKDYEYVKGRIYKEVYKYEF